MTSTNVPIVANEGAKQRKYESTEEFQVSIIHNGWLTVSGKPKETIVRNGLLPKLHRTPRSPIPKWMDMVSRPQLLPSRRF